MLAKGEAVTHDRYTIDALLALTRNHWPAADTDVHAFIMTLARLMDMAGSTHVRVAAERGLSPTEFDVLATLRKQAPPYELTPTGLQQAVVITSGGLTKVLHQLEARDLIARAVDAQDRRSRRVRLTRAGKALIERAMTAVLAAQGQALAPLPARDLDQLITLLRKALAGMERGSKPVRGAGKRRRK